MLDPYVLLAWCLRHFRALLSCTHILLLIGECDIPTAVTCVRPNALLSTRDIAVQNIMMDARPLYPNGHHPIRLKYTPDNVYRATPLYRMDHPVRYYFIDFGISHRFQEGSPRTLLGRRGRNQQVPELSATVPYDAFKVDVYALGDVYYKEFLLVSPPTLFTPS